MNSALNSLKKRARESDKIKTNMFVFPGEGEKKAFLMSSHPLWVCGKRKPCRLISDYHIIPSVQTQQNNKAGTRAALPHTHLLFSPLGCGKVEKSKVPSRNLKGRLLLYKKLYTLHTAVLVLVGKVVN